jgi:DNA-directed RNA polymerase specialized sigma subunit
MSEFQNKYNLTETQVKAMIKDGWLSCSIPHYEQVIYHYKQNQSATETANHFGISRSEVYYIIGRFK